MTTTDETQPQKLSAEAIDQLIGSNYVPLAAKPVRKAPLVKSDSRFISGTVSRFVSSAPRAPIVSPRKRHEQAEELKRKKLQQQMLTLEVTPAQRNRFIGALKKKTDELRNFMVSDIAVFELALSTSLAEMKDELEQLTGSRVDSLVTSRIIKAAEALVEMHAVAKLATTLGVSSEIRKLVLQNMGHTDGNGSGGSRQEKLSGMQALHRLLQVGKETPGQVRGVETPRPAVKPGFRTNRGTRTLHN